MRSTVSTLIRNLVGSEWRVPPDEAPSLPIFNPATGEVIERVPVFSARPVDAAVHAAAEAFDAWSRTAVIDWARLMFRPFSGWKGSFFGDLHVRGTDGINFYTRKKVVVTRW
jgi:acyl-CoA reductase-like NAD-dependent aldehyde dehydrogenase